MSTIIEEEMQKIVGGDSFWKDLGQFLGGFFAGLEKTAPLTPLPNSGAIQLTVALSAGLAAAVNL